MQFQEYFVRVKSTDNTKLTRVQYYNKPHPTKYAGTVQHHCVPRTCCQTGRKALLCSKDSSIEVSVIKFFQHESFIKDKFYYIAGV